jgi:hypothetical protein
MSTTKRVVDFLKQQGFCPEIDRDNGNVVFKYQMANFLFINNDEDEDFFQLIMPGIYDVTEDNREVVLEAINKMNSSIKVVKGATIQDGVWLFFEILLDHTPEVADIFPRALQILQGARQHFYEIIN